MIEHLTDEQIQNFLDRNLAPEQAVTFEKHVDSCQQCQAELARYRYLYEKLTHEGNFSLSPDFSDVVMANIRRQLKKAFLARFWNLVLPILGTGIGIGTMIYYIDIKKLISEFESNLNLSRYFRSNLFSELTQTLAQLNINLNILIFAGLSLLIVILIDQVIARRRDKLISFLKSFTVLTA